MFKLYNFRTMYPDVDHVRLTSRADTRVTRLGKMLRKYRIDELPQLFNVLKGEMSLIGPRPVPESHYSLYLEKIPGYDLRHLIKPGITGLAQVRLGYTCTLEGESQKLKYDLDYMLRAGFLLDLHIIIQTLMLTFNKENKKLVK